TGLESERNNRATSDQSLHLLNSSHIQLKLQQSQMILSLTQTNKTPDQIASAIYLGTLSRPPTTNELQIAEGYYKTGGLNRRQATLDLAWALINSAEFLYQH
ncbi:MAG: hypothetical protein ABSA47_09800, partial [Verrucomicrobiota bacterium]